MLVVSRDGPSLFERNWLRHIQLNWKQLGAARVNKIAIGSIEDLHARYSKLFTEEFGSIQHYQAVLCSNKFFQGVTCSIFH